MNEEFREAVLFGNLDQVRELAATSPELVHETDELGFTSLHEVVSEDQSEMASLLIELGANVNVQNDEGIAPLHLAGYDFMVDVLLDNGADVNLKSHTEKLRSLCMLPSPNRTR